MKKTDFEIHRDEMSCTLREMFEEFLNYPTASGYHKLRNKLGEYYTQSLPYYDQVYKTNQDKMRVELGIGQEG